MDPQYSNIECPECRKAVLEDDINISADIAKCESCGHVFKVSDQMAVRPADQVREESLAERYPSRAVDPVAPGGVSFERMVDGFTLSASTRSPLALFLIPFSLVWIGGSMGGIYGSQLASGNIDPILSLFGLPFLIGSIALIGASAMTSFGKVAVTAQGFDGTVFTGVGSLGWKRSFSWNDIDSVREDQSSIRTNNSYRQLIRLEGRRRISFGTLLSDEKRYFVLKTLENLLDEKR